MSNLFKSPSSTPQWISPSGTDQTRTQLQNMLQARQTATQGPTPLQNSGAQMLQGMFGSNFGTGLSAPTQPGQQPVNMSEGLQSMPFSDSWGAGGLQSMPFSDSRGSGGLQWNGGPLPMPQQAPPQGSPDPWNFGSAYNTGNATLQEAARTGMPISLDMLKSLEAQRMQQLPEQMAGVTEQLTARGMGADTDLARILAETAGKAQTDITATLAPYYLQAGEAQAGRRTAAGQQLLPYAQLPVNASLGAVQVGNTMRETVDPVMQLLSNLAMQGGLGSTAYGPSTGSQLLQAGASILPWLGLSKSLPSLGGMFSTGSDWIKQLFGNNRVNPDIFNQGDPWASVFDWGGDAIGGSGNALGALSDADIMSLLGEF